MASNTTLNGFVSEITDLFETELYDGCFDCTDWDTIKALLTATDQVPPAVDGILIRLKAFLEGLTIDCSIGAQVERLIAIVSDLITKINSIDCESVTCPPDDLFGNLLITTVQSLLLLISNIEYLNGILNYTDPVTITTCGCIATTTLNLFMGRFINSITALQIIMQDWYGIVLNFFHYSAILAKSYVATYVPNNPMQMPVTQTQLVSACVQCPPQPVVPTPPPPPCSCDPFIYL